MGVGRVLSGEVGFVRRACLALVSGTVETLRWASGIGWRVEKCRLENCGKMRMKGAYVVIREQSERDSVLASTPGGNLSCWAVMRLPERLESFGAVRALSG